LIKTHCFLLLFAKGTTVRNLSNGESSLPDYGVCFKRRLVRIHQFQVWKITRHRRRKSQKLFQATCIGDSALPPKKRGT